jgi:hypothetical protein
VRSGRMGMVAAMSRARRLFLRLIVVALALGAVCFGSLWVYAEYEAHRPESILAELSRVQIGDAEGSVLALTGRYGGFKWTPEPSSAKEQWIDKHHSHTCKERKGGRPSFLCWKREMLKLKA